MDSSIMSSLRLVSHNCRGLRVSSKVYLNKLLYDCDILFLQEHWLSVDQLGLLANINADYFSRGICGFDNSEVLKGRSHGGCGILYRRSFNCQGC